MVDLQQNVNTLLDAALSKSTHTPYESALQAFQAFRRIFKLPWLWPVPENQVTLFIAFNYERRVAPATVKTYLSGLSYHHKLRSKPDPTKTFAVTKMIEGYNRLEHRKDIRLPITLQILSQLPETLDKICSSKYESLLFKSAYLIAFFGLFRVGELVFTTPAYASRPLMLNDVAFNTNSISISVRQSKCDQLGISQPVSIRKFHNKDICPVQTLHSFLLVRPKISDYLFTHSNGHPLTRYQFSVILSKCMRHLDLPEARFKSHSFRIGGATYLAQQNVPDEIIQKQGRWTSTAYLSYLR